MDGKWRPICHGKQWCEGRKECAACPFKATCASRYEAMRGSGRWERRPNE